MAGLPDYPIPELDVTLGEVGRVLQLTLGQDLYQQYESTVEQQGGVLQDAQQELSASAAGRENWGTERFKRGMLSLDAPLPNSTAIAVALPPSRADGCTQLGRSAALLWAAAKLYSEPELLKGGINTGMEDTQQSEVFAATLIPGRVQDEIKVFPDSLHAIVTSVGGVFPVDIVSHPVSGGQRSAQSFSHVWKQLARVVDDLGSGRQGDPPVVCGLSALERRAWAAAREEILGLGGDTAASLGVMESAILALSLEEWDAPSDIGDLLKAVRLGREGSPYLRYYDKMLNIVVFKDGTAGMLFEHSAVDGMVATLIAELVYNLSETADVNRSDLEEEPSAESRVDPDQTPLAFSLRGVNLPEPCTDLRATHPVVLSFDLPSYPDVFSTLRGVRGVFDAWVNFSLQLALTHTLGESAAGHIFVTPTHMRHFKHGRCDPTYSVTLQSRGLVAPLVSCLGSGNPVQYSTDLLRLFHAAFREHKNLIRKTKRGEGVGPHIGVLRQSLPSHSPLKQFLNSFGCPSVYVTGADLIEGADCVIGNVYGQDQLVVNYYGKRDKVRVLLMGKGIFAPVLEDLFDCFRKSLQVVMHLALRYAVASQMGALECLLQHGPAEIMNRDGRAFPENGSPKGSPGTIADPPTDGSGTIADSTSGQSTEVRDYTLLIHGGAEEVMMLDSEVIGVIEFALQAALSLGSRVLQEGGRSLDAVQKSVEALEDCFLFNAGKGSVFNRDVQNEMEATIIDGSGKRSGSIACVQNVKNPIKAARHVMEESPHTLIVGGGAEEFLAGLEGGEKPVGPDYFHTDIRHRQLMARLGGGNSTETNHTQTVGAVAVDSSRGLAAASSTGGVVGKLKGRVGDTAVVGAGMYADDKVAIACSGDGDAFLRHTVAQKVASLYHNKGYSLRRACREVMVERLGGVTSGIIAVDVNGDAVTETNAAVMFVASMVNGVSRVEILRPLKGFSHVIWETDELVAYLDPNPWTPGATILARKMLNGASSIFQLAIPDFVSMLQGARAVSSILCERLGVQRCALVSKPTTPDRPTEVRLLPLHGLEEKWESLIAQEEEYHPHHPGFCTSKNGPRWEEDALTRVKEKIRSVLPTPDSPSCFDFFGDPSDDNLFSRIVRGELQQWRVWEDSHHVAFLTPFPNTPGFTVLAPRRPLSSDIFALEGPDFEALILAAYKVAHLLEKGMSAQGVALIFEGYEIDYAHAKLVPVIPAPPDVTAMADPQSECFHHYPAFVSSLPGPPADPETLKEMHLRITQCRPPRSWEDPQSHPTVALTSQWYRNLFRIQDTLFHSTVEYFHGRCRYAYALTPLTTDTISSPMGLGSDSEPVSVNLLGMGVHLADSMQFALEYFLRFQEDLPGTYYITSSFRGEDTDATHLNQFYHVECELLGDIEGAMSIAEGYLAHLTRSMLREHSDLIVNTAGMIQHLEDFLSKLDANKQLPRVPLDQAISMMPSADCSELVQDDNPEYGRKLTRKGERVLIEKYGGAVWLTEMDHLGVAFYQAYIEGTGQRKAKAADLLLGLGETLGLGERHVTPERVQEALLHHGVSEETYRWYIDMRRAKTLLTSGWGMGTERYLCWVLQHDDVRDMHIIPRLKGVRYTP